MSRRSTPAAAVPARGNDPMKRVNRNVYIEGRRTSVTMEQIFWHALDDMARAEGTTVLALVQRLHARNSAARAMDLNLTSMLRVAVMAWYRGTALAGSESRAA